mgnify:CR=1 FL=1
MSFSACHFRRNLLDTCGKIGLTFCHLRSPLFHAFDELRKLQEISDAKGGPTGGESDTGIRKSQAGPGCWQRSHLLRGLVKGHAIFSPIVTVGEDLKLLAIQGMKGMGDPEDSLR